MICWIVVLLIHGCFAFDASTHLQGASFHHAIDYLRAHARTPSSISITLPSLLPFVLNDSRCTDDLLLLGQSLINKELWALKVIDAWGTKPPAGILEGSHLWLGSYDECIHSLYLPNNRTYVQQPFSTQYCTLLSRKNAEEPNTVVRNVSMVVGLCLPWSCRSEDFQLHSMVVQCPSKTTGYSVGMFLTVILIVFLCLFVCVSSWIPFLHDYSLVSSVKKIFSTGNVNAHFHFFNGIRALSLLWIILGHSYLFQLTMADNVLTVMNQLHNSWLFQFLPAATFAVDHFLFISGFLSVLVLLRKFSPVEPIRFQHFLIYYIHRYCRLIPTLGFVLLVSLYLTPWMGDGPMYPKTTGFELATCRQQWWTTFLFLNNLIDPSNACLLVTWYLAVDFQYHLLAPLLLLPFLLNHRRWTYIILTVLLLANIFTIFGILLNHPGLESGMFSDTSASFDYFEKIYITPWCRSSAFLIGMMTKLFLDQHHGNVSCVTKIFGNTVSVLLVVYCIFFPFYSHSFPLGLSIVYQMFCHLCWSLAFAWLVIVCSKSSNNWLKKMLSWSVWTIMGRLSYAAYLIHTIIILSQVYNRTTTLHYQGSVLFNGFVSQVCLTLLMSLIVVIIVEMPFAVLEKKIRLYFTEKKRSITGNHQHYGAIN